ncbi:hypothetical protein [Mesorhizobium sp. WSM2239]|uniref:Uncharacterized protein n=2 Tax=unclassified Mesorhizobium TaxID=325217 RepID=A0AAU8D8Q1_9HYPH
MLNFLFHDASHDVTIAANRDGSLTIGQRHAAADGETVRANEDDESIKQISLSLYKVGLGGG